MIGHHRPTAVHLTAMRQDDAGRALHRAYVSLFGLRQTYERKKGKQKH
jgi:hypothetical protein